MTEVRTVPLGELIKPAKTMRAGENEYPVLSMTMNNGLMDQNQKFKKNIASKDLSGYKVVKRCQLVVSFPIDEGVLDFQQLYDEAIVSPAYGIWDVIDGVEVDIDYLGLALRSERSLMYYKAKLQGSTARRRSLPKEVFLALPIELPNLEEQKNEVEKTRLQKQVKEKRERQRELLAELEKSIFQHMFYGCSDYVQLGDIATFIGGSSLPEGEFFAGQEDGVLLMKVSDMNLTGNQKEIIRTGLWLNSYHNQSQIVPAGSIILPKRGASISTNKKRMATRDTLLDPNLMAVVPNREFVDVEYLYHWFLQFDLQLITSGSSVPQLNKKDLLPLMVPLPGKMMQRKFKNIIQSIQIDF
ncbi:hypothetical protein [Rothia sp. (in: high G+C Gram-positive bacteria)]|uniref:hypothetical protein n=1 Tax=Rothia sp. (in: high G+C Gram-positive bacteria) TaxID=1885016 RepID=UPI003216C4E7